MTRIQIGQKIRENLKDYGVSYYSVDDLNDSIQDAVDEIIVYSECLDNKTELQFQPDLTYYNLTQLIPDYYRLVRIWHPTISAFFNINSDRRELSFRSDWEIRVGAPRDLVIVGTDRIAFSGRLFITTDKFWVFYKATAPTLNDNINIPININYMQLVENYCTADLLEQNEEFAKAEKHWNIYDVELLAYKEKIQLLSKSDRVFTRR